MERERSRIAITLACEKYDVYDVSRLERELRMLQPGESVVDCRNVQYLDSTALGVLIRALKRLRERDVQSRITLTNISPAVRKIFEITRLDCVFALH